MKNEKLALIGLVIVYCTIFICFTTLAIITQKWWIILLTLLYRASLNINFEGENEEDD